MLQDFVEGHNYSDDDYDEPARIERHIKWITENNFFQYDSEKNKWIVLPPMPAVLFNPIMIVLGECVYVLGSENDHYECTQMVLRYSIPNKTWSVEVEDYAFGQCTSLSYVGTC